MHTTCAVPLQGGFLGTAVQPETVATTQSMRYELGSALASAASHAAQTYLFGNTSPRQDLGRVGRCLKSGESFIHGFIHPRPLSHPPGLCCCCCCDFDGQMRAQDRHGQWSFRMHGLMDGSQLFCRLSASLAPHRHGRLAFHSVSQCHHLHSQYTQVWNCDREASL